MGMLFKEDVQRYCIALFTTIIATQMRLAIGPWVEDHIPFGVYMISVVLTAWLAGTGPAIAALILGIAAAATYIIPPENTILITDVSALISLFIYGLVGMVTIWMFEINSRQHELTRGQLRQIRKLTSELKQTARHKDEFLALLAHELRNPLAPIRSGLMLLQQEDIDERERSRVVKTICRQLQQLIRIVDDLLDVSRFVHGQILLECQPIDLREAVETALEQTQSDFKSRHHEVKLLMPVQPVPIHGDRVRLVQIISNLLTNASKYTPRQGRIQIMLEVQEQQARLSVTDNGIGITREMQQHIFELFARSDAAIRRDQGGLGLGLPIAKQFADMHGGTLSSYSEGADQGSRFELTLPLIPLLRLQQAGPDRSRSVCSKPEKNGYSETLVPTESFVPTETFVATETIADPVDPQKTRVLIVDDNTDAAETLAMLLSFEGYESLCVEDGFQALRQVNDYRPDIVLLDIGLPGMDGYEIARRLREEFLLQPLTLIAVTGWGGEEDLRKSQQAGIDHHLVKPVNPEELFRLMHASQSSQPSTRSFLRS